MKVGELALNNADRNALEMLFADHRPRLLAFARQRLDRARAGKVDAEDMLSEAFLRAAARLEDLRQWGMDKAYPNAAPDRGRITGFQSSTSYRRPRQVSWVVRVRHLTFVQIALEELHYDNGVRVERPALSCGTG